MYESRTEVIMWSPLAVGTHVSDVENARRVE